jgi:hypothetical protein
MVINRFSGVTCWQSGHLVIGTAPYCNHEGQETKVELDVSGWPDWVVGLHRWEEDEWVGEEAMGVAGMGAGAGMAPAPVFY